MPAIFGGPQKFCGTISEIGSTLDFYKTFSALTRNQAKDNLAIDSHDLSAVLLRQADSPRDSFFYYSCTKNPKDTIFAVRYKRWKAQFISCDPDEFIGNSKRLEKPFLYDLDINPEETHNIAEDHPEIINLILTLKLSHEETIIPHEDMLKARLNNQDLPRLGAVTINSIFHPARISGKKSFPMVARPRIELGTQGFSVLCSTN